MQPVDLMDGWEIFRVENGQEGVDWHVAYLVPGIYSGSKKYVAYLIDEEKRGEIFDSDFSSLQFTEVGSEWLLQILPVKGKIGDVVGKSGSFQKRWREIEEEFIEKYNLPDKWSELWKARYSFRNGYAETVLKMVISDEADIKEFESSRIMDLIDVPRKNVDIETNEPEEVKTFQISKYFINPANEQADNSVHESEYVSAAIEISKWEDWDEYFEAVRKGNRKGAVYPAKRAAREGYYCKRFEWENHIPDIAEINFSKEERTGRKMTDSYKRSVDELGGAPVEKRELRDVANSRAWWIPWGVFKTEEGHMQGEVETNEKLVGYIGLTREGDLCSYGTILGHGDHLGFGIMYLLHFEIMKSIMKGEEEYFKGIEYVLYATFLSGSRPDGGQNTLIPWKMKLLFGPIILHSIPDSVD